MHFHCERPTTLGLEDHLATMQRLVQQCTPTLVVIDPVSSLARGLGERNRGLYALKSRGMAHSNQIREFLLSDAGVHLVPVVVGPTGVLTGSARAAADSADRATALGLADEAAALATALERRRVAVESHVATLWADFGAEESLTQRLIETSARRQEALRQELLEQGRHRTATERAD